MASYVRGSGIATNTTRKFVYSDRISDLKFSVTPTTKLATGFYIILIKF